MNEIIKNKKKSELIVETIMQMKYGEVIKHISIASMIEEKYPSQKYMAVVQSAKKVLMKEYGIILESIRGDGYRVVNPDYYVNHSLRHFKRGFNEFQRGFQTLNHAPVKDMSEEGREVYRRVNDRAMILNASLNGAVVELKTLGKKNHPFIPKNIKSN